VDEGVDLAVFTELTAFAFVAGNQIGTAFWENILQVRLFKAGVRKAD